MLGQQADEQGPRLVELPGLAVLFGEEVAQASVVGALGQQLFKPLDEFALLVQRLERLGQQFVRFESAAGQTLLEGGLDVGQGGLGAFAPGLDPGKMKTQQRRVRRQPIRLAERRLRLVRPVRQKEVLAEERLGRSRAGHQLLGHFLVQPELPRLLQRVEHPPGAIRGLGVLLVDDVHLGQAPRQEDVDGRPRGLLFRSGRQNLFKDGDDSPEHVLAIDVVGQIDQFAGVDRLGIEFGQRQQIAIPLGGTIELVGQQDDLARRGLGRGIVAQRALVVPQRGGELLAFFQRASRGEERQGVKAVGVRLGRGRFGNKRFGRVVERKGRFRGGT